MSKSYSARLLNHTEPMFINGVNKTAFYSEHSIDIKVGDKLFILNGNYDTDSYVYKYARNSKFVDGYRVLFIEKCKIVLDIDWDSTVGVYEELDINEFIKVWNVRSIQELNYYETITTDLYPDKINRYAYRQTNDIIFIDKAFDLTQVPVGKFKYFNNTILDDLLDPRGHFFGIDNGVWIEDDYRFTYNNYNDGSLGGVMDFLLPYNITNNGKLYIIGEDIVIDSNHVFRQRSVYKYANNPGEYVIDIKYKKPLISKLNFRGGVFNGNHNDGVFGTYLAPISWESNGVWDGGFFINSNWNSGEMRSDINSGEIFKAYIENGIVKQISDLTSNNNFGYNYIIDSTISSGVILNGNFENCNIGGSAPDNSNGYANLPDVVDGVGIYGGFYELCDISNTGIVSATLTASNISNSELSNSRLIDSQVGESFVSKCDIYENSGINVIGAEIMCDWLIDGFPIRSVSSVGGIDGVFTKLQNVIKLWISSEDYYKLNSFDSFFISKINKSYFIANLTTDEMIKLPIETELMIGKFYNIELSDKELVVSLKTIMENRYKTKIIKNGNDFERISDINNKNNYSIDIQISGDANTTYGNLGYYLENGVKITPSDINTSMNKLSKLDIDKLFGSSFVSKFNMKSGLIVESDWISGSNMNRINLLLSSIYVDSGKIKANIINLAYLMNFESDYIKSGDRVWLDGVYNSGVIFSDELIIEDINISSGVITLIGVNGVTYGGSYVLTIRTLPTVSYITKLKIKDSKVSGGFFNRTLFDNTTFDVNKYVESETVTIENINKMRVVNNYFELNNTLNSGIFHNSNFISGSIVNGGILSKSNWYSSDDNIFKGGVFTDQGIWNDGIFTSGVFAKSLWVNGVFLDGTFKDNSNWSFGNFVGGNFYNATWVGGIIDGGIFGNTAYNVYSTKIQGETIINDIIVTNAIIGGLDLLWNMGTFNGGQFTGGLWKNGTFNGGEFVGGLWEDGIFNGGKFISLEPVTFAWINGTFNGGEFGNKRGYGKNPSWENGLFQGGIFQGHTWDNGTFTNGIFTGAKWDKDVNGNLLNDVYVESYKYLDNNINSSVQYGIWNSGIVINNKFEVLTEEYTYDDVKKTRVNGATKVSNYVEFDSMLWKGGTFSHTNGNFNNSVWFSGNFEKGFVNGSYINPYVRRIFGNQTSTFGECTWYGGVFNSGVMFKTTWCDGTWNDGVMWGSIWKKGVWNYGTANGVLWLDGRWRNGNWDGSPYTNIVTSGSTITSDNFSKTLIDFINSGVLLNNILLNSLYPLNVSNSDLTNKIHINNYCNYNVITNPSDPNSIASHTVFPTNWYDENNTMSTNIFTVPLLSNTTVYRLNATYCDDVKCYYDADLFIDVFYGYEINLSFGGVIQDDVYVHLNIGDMFGDTNIATLLPGASGFDNDGKPVVRLNTTPTNFKFIYFPKLIDSSKSLTYYVENKGTSNTIVTISDIVVNRIKTQYDSLNNSLIDFGVGINSNLPNTVFTNINVENGNIIKFKYGNGSFNKGVWENGVWNDGYRDDKTENYADSVGEFIQISEFVYIISLFINTDLSMYSLGDKVSVSNIIGIDYNNKRKLIKGSLVIRDIQKANKKIILEVVTNYKLRLIKKDSEFHIIKITQNVWLSGAFLNGFYNGIMNYGIVSGFPYITQLDNIHMIDGIFDGGKIGSNKKGNLVQNFLFYDNAVVKRNYYVDKYPINKPISNSRDRFYRSWAAFEYIEDNNRVNLYSNDVIYNPKWYRNTSVLNHSGRSTNDVISSRSRLTNLNNIDQRTYDLGVDQTTYDKYIPHDGVFTYPIKVGVVNDGVEQFVNYGWGYKTIQGSTLPQLTSNYSNTIANNSNVLFVDVPPSGSFILNNTGKKELYYDMLPQIDTERYSVIEFQLRGFNGDVQYDTETPSLFFGNSPSEYSINKSIVNHLTTDNLGKVRYEYFFNRTSLDMYLLSNTLSSSFEIKSIKFNELDMIPFFNYFTDTNNTDHIDDSAKAPKYIKAPKIIYSDDYDFVDNITSTIDIASLNIPVNNNKIGIIKEPILGDNVIVDELSGVVTFSWSDPDPLYIGNIAGYEVSYGVGYPYTTLPIVNKTQLGIYTQTITLDPLLSYIFRVRSVGNKNGQYSTHVVKRFTFGLNRIIYYIGYVTAGLGLVTIGDKIVFNTSNKIYVETDGKCYVDKYSYTLANQLNDLYRVISDTEFNGALENRTSYTSSIFDNKLVLEQALSINPITVYDVPGYSNWDNVNNTPSVIGDLLPTLSVIKNTLYAVNTSRNINIGDKLFDVAVGGYSTVLSSRWIAIKLYHTMSGSVAYIYYVMVRMDSSGVVVDLIPSLVFTTTELSLTT